VYVASYVRVALNARLRTEYHVRSVPVSRFEVYKSPIFLSFRSIELRCITHSAIGTSLAVPELVFTQRLRSAWPIDFIGVPASGVWQSKSS
jgi:hypothetical protein